MKILITGANGLLGQKLTQLLAKDNQIDLVATARGALSVPLQRGSFFPLDISNQREVDHVIQQTQPDVIINTAAMTNVDACELQREACWKANVESVQYLVDACEKNSIRLIHVSTDFIFDGTHGPLDENEKPNPVNYYGESKLAAEKIIQQSKLDWCILRTVLVFGISSDMSRSNIVLWVKKSLEERKTISVVNDQWRTPTLAEDLAIGCYLVATKNAKGIYNISGKDFLSPFDIAIMTAEFFKLDKNLIRATDSTQFKQPAARPLKTGFIIDKAKKELGYEPHSFQQGLAILQSQL
ncbi:MAG: NAD(P)-dependent oxidoreductase [Flammeovirgaceae bacterium]|nr:NAD(P)-dependent oxidoreductase [Flammeovirgaceae bacterium]